MFRINIEQKIQNIKQELRRLTAEEENHSVVLASHDGAEYTYAAHPGCMTECMFTVVDAETTASNLSARSRALLDQMDSGERLRSPLIHWSWEK